MSDVIYRQAAIQTALEFIVEYLGGAFNKDFQKMLMKRMNALPSAQPERKKGCKIVKGTGTYGYCACDQCGKPVHPEDLFCSKCGADFREDDT